MQGAPLQRVYPNLATPFGAALTQADIGGGRCASKFRVGTVMNYRSRSTPLVVGNLLEHLAAAADGAGLDAVG